MSEDPFDHLDADEDREGDGREPSDGVSGEAADREGDPFDSLDEETSTDGTPEDVDGDAATPADAGNGDHSVPDASAREGPDADDGDPVDVAGDAFGDVDVSRGDPFEESTSAFQRVDVDSVDPDAVWDRFTESVESTDDSAEAPVGGEEVPEDVPDTVEVPKGRFCQTCPHFSPPPEVSCNHEGTEILRFVGTDDVRVKNCPVVAERRELGESYE